MRKTLPFPATFTPSLPTERIDGLWDYLDAFEPREDRRYTGLRLVMRLEVDSEAQFTGNPLQLWCTYMGAAEYEWGAVPGSYDAMRFHGDIEKVAVTCSVAGQDTTVYLIGNAESVAAVADKFVTWTEPNGKERTYFEQVVTAQQWAPRKVNAWWSLTDQVVWTHDADVADKLHTVFASGNPL